MIAEYGREIISIYNLVYETVSLECNRIDDLLKMSYSGISFIMLGSVITATKGNIFINHEKKEDCKGKNPKLITDQTFTKHRKLVQDTERKDV